MRFSCAVLALCVLFAAGCGKRKAPRAPTTPQPGKHWVETGVASWYGYPYHGRQTASGEVYDMEKLTAAHRSLPFGTDVKVINLDNGRKTEVKVTDRGPFVEGRIIDLSRHAARDIDMIRPGTARVRLEADVPLEPPKGMPAYGVLLGSFEKKRQAEDLKKRIGKKYGPVVVQEVRGRERPWRVTAGRKFTIEDARTLVEPLKRFTGAAYALRLDE
jgi:rare lipoprotein A